MLTPAEVFELDKRIGARTDRWIANNIGRRQIPPKAITKTISKASTRGRRPKVIKNPFFTYIGPTTAYGRYPGFAQDVIEGVARLDWHARPIDSGGKSMPLSVRKCFVILEMLDEVTTVGVQELFSYSQSQAQRYMKAMELAIPFMMKARPPSLIADMNGDLLPGESPWTDELLTPIPDALAKLHHDLRPLGQSN
ncbi:hypothetical protein PUP68_04855 [Pseudomonas chlororaphis]|uniref:hypothetical protein n=1 Tax=Pseudomonas chlororaphis TaxID=587753 RepID=UPI0006A62D12|nr:hypothetical protein [Pseudomonas chlororaphis]AZC28749.1 hypothetical protein C4K38_0767 [Pseudomonas chlororaphis subsp. piscium]WDG80509.1 hypothetical protein PUP77_07385 [Pseudomonas chlororaphis]WDG86437.1 hypothetical protein PUP68_04855 [Pseudomonas chlororaphis]WDG92756.1 hypothetical protein PUP49_04870 [Pseudomonas chlororaphis]SDR75426.1 hypothetical protein SAMN05216585_0110 [Pseudomonas chlororaphis]